MRLKAIIFDWAGTAVDFGCLCPVQAFQAAFAEKGITVSAEQVQRFMGIRKREHVSAVMSLPEVAAQWQAIHRGGPDASAVDVVYEGAEKKMVELVADSAAPTPYLIEALARVRSRGLKVGSTTGYTRPIMARLTPAARHLGFTPDFVVASDEVAQGRPYPWMLFKNMEALGIYPPAAVVKLGDTVADMQEALNGGVWAIGITESSSLVGKGLGEWTELTSEERERLNRKAGEQLLNAGAHLVIPNLSELATALDQINARLERGETPPAEPRTADDFTRSQSPSLTVTGQAG